MEQSRRLGLSFDFDRQFATSDEDYYKWTQWIFLKLFENGKAYNLDTMYGYGYQAVFLNEDVTEEQLGGALVQNQVSGVAHLLARDEMECFAQIRKLLSYMPPSNRGTCAIYAPPEEIFKWTKSIDNIKSRAERLSEMMLAKYKIEKILDPSIEFELFL